MTTATVSSGADVRSGKKVCVSADLGLVRRLAGADHGLAVVATTRRDGKNGGADSKMLVDRTLRAHVGASSPEVSDQV